MIEIKQLKEITPEVTKAFARLIPQLSPDCKTPTEENLETIISNKNNYIFIACNPAIVGTLTLAIVSTPSGAKGWIEDVVVDSCLRGQGAGKQLIEHAIRFASGLNITSINLTSIPDRIAANKLYKEMGFVLRETNVYRIKVS